MRRLEKKKKDVDKELKQDVSSSPFVANTHDGWTSLNTQSFFTTTVHYVNNDSQDLGSRYHSNDREPHIPKYFRGMKSYTHKMESSRLPYCNNR